MLLRIVLKLSHKHVILHIVLNLAIKHVILRVVIKLGHELFENVRFEGLFNDN